MHQVLATYLRGHRTFVAPHLRAPHRSRSICFSGYVGYFGLRCLVGQSLQKQLSHLSYTVRRVFSQIATAAIKLSLLSRKTILL